MAAEWEGYPEEVVLMQGLRGDRAVGRGQGLPPSPLRHGWWARQETAALRETGAHGRPRWPGAVATRASSTPHCTLEGLHPGESTASPWALPPLEKVPEARS